MGWIKSRFEGGDDRVPPPPLPPTPQPEPVIAGVVAPSPPGGGTPAAPADRSDNPMRTLLVHGYSASGTEFGAWKAALGAAKDANGQSIAIQSIEIGNYVSLNNEITIKDLGEAFDRALRFTAWSQGSKDDSWTFDAIVHSTGMLVVRQWLVSDPFSRDDPRSRVKRLKHLIGLAPATFGSPQGKKGRSWLGALVKGNRDFGPDFMNAGDRVLDGLELASRYTWNLAKQDMLCIPPMYSQGSDTPYAAVFIGNQPYTGISAAANSPGCDGTVRWAGCALNARLVQLDFRRETKLVDDNNKLTRAKISKWEDDRLECPMLAVEGMNHGSILSPNPDPDTVQRVTDFFLTVNSDESYKAWLDAAKQHSLSAKRVMDNASLKKRDDGSGFDGGRGWQQFVLHVVDDHGDAVSDYNVQLYVGDDLTQSDDPQFPSVPLIADTYTADSSYRCFYVRLSDDMLNAGGAGSTKKVWAEVIASSGTAYLEYLAYMSTDPNEVASSAMQLAPATVAKPAAAAQNVVKLDLTNLGSGTKFFYPYTTTLIEIVLEREPTPLKDVSGLFQFWQGNQTANEPS